MSYIDSLKKLGDVVSEILDDGEQLYTIVSGKYDVIFHEDPQSKKRVFYYAFVIGDEYIYHDTQEFYPGLDLSDVKNIGEMSLSNTNKLSKILSKDESPSIKNTNYLESMGYESYYTRDFKIFGKIPFNSIFRVSELIDKKYSGFDREVNRLMGFSQVTIPIINTNSKLVKFDECHWKAKKGVYYIVDTQAYRIFRMKCPRVNPIGMIDFTGDLVKDYTMLYKILMIILRAKGKIEILVRKNVFDVVYYYLTMMAVSYTSVDTLHKNVNRYISYNITRLSPFIEISDYNKELIKAVKDNMELTSTIFERKKGVQRSAVVDKKGRYSIMNRYLIKSNGVISKALELIKADGFTEKQINTEKRIDTKNAMSVMEVAPVRKRKRTPSKKKYQPTVKELSDSEHVLSLIKIGKNYDTMLSIESKSSHPRVIEAYKKELDKYKKHKLDDYFKYLELTDPKFPFKPRGTKEGQLEKLTFYRYESYGYKINPDIFKKCKTEFSVPALKYIYNIITDGKSTTFKVKDKLCSLVNETLQN